MFQHHTKNKGDLGVLKVKLDLFLQGYLVLVPETEHAPFDLVIYKEGVFRTVQVKYRAVKKNGVIDVDFRSKYAFSKGVVSKPVDKSVIDLYAIYCPDTDCCYYFDPKQFSDNVSLRVSKPLNNQSLNVHFASDFNKVP